MSGYIVDVRDNEVPNKSIGWMADREKWSLYIFILSLFGAGCFAGTGHTIPMVLSLLVSFICILCVFIPGLFFKNHLEAYMTQKDGTQVTREWVLRSFWEKFPDSKDLKDGKEKEQFLRNVRFNPIPGRSFSVFWGKGLNEMVIFRIYRKDEYLDGKVVEVVKIVKAEGIPKAKLMRILDLRWKDILAATPVKNPVAWGWENDEIKKQKLAELI